jgi:adenosylcobinamide-phosphate synthase
MLSTTLTIAFAALVIERLVGYPKIIHEAIGHPVEWIGAVIGGFEEALNRPGGNRLWQELKGAFALLLTLLLVAILTIPFSLWLRQQEWGWLLEAVLATTLLAQFDLYRHVRAVYAGLETSIESGRAAVSRIVGRDPDQLDESGVARAAIESLAENSSDAVVAPAMFLALFGLPGIALYKVINTADSMIGHRSPRFIDFGWAAARLDDLLNLIPARLTGLLLAGAASLTSPVAGADALARMWYDARRHVSPNAGWPEAAMAGALNIRLGGPRSYDGSLVELAWLGNGRIELDRRDIRRALRLFSQMITLFAAFVALAAAFTFKAI